MVWRALAWFALVLGLAAGGQILAAGALADTPSPSPTSTEDSSASPTTPEGSPTPPQPSDSPTPAPTVTETVTAAPAPSPASSDQAVHLTDDQYGPLLWTVLAGFAIVLLFLGVSTAKILFGR